MKKNSSNILVSIRTASDTVIFKLALDQSLEFADDDDSATMFTFRVQWFYSREI